MIKIDELNHLINTLTSFTLFKSFYSKLKPLYINLKPSLQEQLVRVVKIDDDSNGVFGPPIPLIISPFYPLFLSLQQLGEIDLDNKWDNL